MEDSHALSLLSDNDRAALSELDAEELASIQSAVIDPYGAASTAPPAAGDAALAVPVDDAQAAVEVTAVEPDPAPAPQAEAAADTVAETAPAQRAAVYTYEKPADFDAQAAAIAEEKLLIKNKLRDGDLDIEAYEEQRDALESRSTALNNIALKAEIAGDISQQTESARWASAIDAQFAAAKLPENGGVDYAANDELRNDLDVVVRALGSNPKNADKTYDWFMREAHRRVLVLHEIAPVKAAPVAPAAAPVDNKKAAMAARAPSPASIPVTLAHAPDAGGNDATQGDPFAAIDALTGNELMTAIARMSPQERNRYEALG